MAGVLLLGHGDFDQYSYREDLTVPDPGHGDVLIQVEACSVNNTDVNVRTDWYAGQTDESPLGFPRIQGADVAGRIVELGAGVDPSRLEERVIVDPELRTGMERHERASASGLLGYDMSGGFAEYVVVPAVNAYKVPEELPAAELAAYPVAYATALEMILRSRARPAETMVVTGASGGVGTALIQLGKVFRLDVIAIASQSKAQRLRELGADLVIDRHSPTIVDDIRDAGIASVDVVADVVGGTQMAELLGLLRPAGTCVTAGGISGPISPIDLRHLIYKDIDLRGVAFSRSSTFGTLVGLISSGAIRAAVAATYPLRELATAQREFIKKQYVGKIVLTV
jgi:NADPH:quinone reductase-like Zn-dependent oxidoreductase